MGQDIEPQTFRRTDRANFKEKLRRCQRACDRMLADAKFETGIGQAGIEIEFNVVESDFGPAMRNTEVLRAIGDPSFQTELGRYTVEVNIPPHRLADRGLEELEDDIRRHVGMGERGCRDLGLTLMTIGILPTLGREHMGIDVLSSNPRYLLLNEQIFMFRGEDIILDIDGVERLTMRSETVAPESACMATQLHLQVSPDLFASYWNAAQAIGGAQVALCANSPFLFGKELWRETRIQLFEQAIDNRTSELIAQGVRPRVWFGDRWISSAAELFTENMLYFSPLLPVCEDEDPLAVLDAGGTPRLSELRLHNGTIYRWNRPVYDVVAHIPHLRIENRIPPSGPTIIDTVANAAFWFGLIRRLVDDENPVWSRMSYDAAAANFFAGARHGLDATLYWPGLGMVGARELLLRRLVPLAYEGLDAWHVTPEIRDRLLAVVERRAATGTNGATWQAAEFHRWYDGTGLDRFEALRAMTRSYIEHMASGEPVHRWPC